MAKSATIYVFKWLKIIYIVFITKKNWYSYLTETTFKLILSYRVQEKKNASPQNNFFKKIVSQKRVRSHQRKVTIFFVRNVFSSHQDCYVHQFSDVRFRLYRSLKKSGYLANNFARYRISGRISGWATYKISGRISG